MRDEEGSAGAIGDLDRELFNAVGTRFTVRELRERVTMLEPGIVLVREITRGTPETWRVMLAAIEELTSGFDAYGIVIDLEEVSGTITREYRRFIPESFDQLHARSAGRLKKVGVAFVGNHAVRIVAKFLLARMTRAPVDLERSRAHALEIVRRALQSPR